MRVQFVFTLDFQINTAVSAFRRLVDAISTAKDTPEHRLKLSVLSLSFLFSSLISRYHILNFYVLNCSPMTESVTFSMCLLFIGDLQFSISNCSIFCLRCFPVMEFACDLCFANWFRRTLFKHCFPLLSRLISLFHISKCSIVDFVVFQWRNSPVICDLPTDLNRIWWVFLYVLISVVFVVVPGILRGSGYLSLWRILLRSLKLSANPITAQMSR